MSTILGDRAIADVTVDKDLKISELEFKEKGLQRLSEKVKKQKASLFWMLNQHFYKVLPYRSAMLQEMPGSVVQIVMQIKGSLFGSMKNKYIDGEIAKLPQGTRKTIRIKRQTAQRFIDTGKCDHTGEFTIFGQIHTRCREKADLKDSFRMNGTDE